MGWRTLAGCCSIPTSSCLLIESKRSQLTCGTFASNGTISFRRSPWKSSANWMMLDGRSGRSKYFPTAVLVPPAGWKRTGLPCWVMNPFHLWTRSLPTSNSSRRASAARNSRESGQGDSPRSQPLIDSPWTNGAAGSDDQLPHHRSPVLPVACRRRARRHCSGLPVR